MATDVKVPTLGESITEATVGQWLKQPGDAVAADEAIASLETDKVAVEVNAPVAGTMGEQLVAEGDNVEVGAVIARIETNGAAAKPSAAPQQQVAETVQENAGENIELRDDEDDVRVPLIGDEPTVWFHSASTRNGSPEERPISLGTTWTSAICSSFGLRTLASSETALMRFRASVFSSSIASSRAQPDMTYLLLNGSVTYRW
jgi:pyruvate/2-oxoglutarate dehydrogenase complex dihydrolipoamide acyltransferase (E2) component